MAEITFLLLLSVPVAFMWGTLMAWRHMQHKTVEYQLRASMRALGIVQINRGKR